MARKRNRALPQSAPVNRVQTKTPAPITRRALWSSPSSSGKRIQEDDLLGIDTVFACINVLAQAIASTPIDLFRRGPNGRDKAREHPVYPLVHVSPNEEMTSFEWRLSMMTSALLRGNAIAQVIRSAGGEVLEIYPLDWCKTKPERTNSGELVYNYKGQDKEYTLKASEVLHIRGLSQNGLIGLALAEYQKDAFGITKATEDHGAKFFANDASPGGVLEAPGPVTDKAYERLKQSWEDRHKGSDKAHKVAILEEGLKFHGVSVTPEEAQALESRKYQRSVIAGLFRVPAHLINDLEKATFSNIEHLNLAFVTHTLTPWFENIEQRMAMTLLTPDERKEYYFRHNPNNLLRGDFASRTAGYSQAIQNGWMSPNEVREREEMNGYEGGDQYFINSASVPVEQAGQPQGATNAAA